MAAGLRDSRRRDPLDCVLQHGDQPVPASLWFVSSLWSSLHDRAHALLQLETDELYWDRSGPPVAVGQTQTLIPAGGRAVY